VRHSRCVEQNYITAKIQSQTQLNLNLVVFVTIFLLYCNDEVAVSFENSVHIYPSKWRHFPDESNFVGTTFRYDSESVRDLSLRRFRVCVFRFSVFVYQLS